MAHNDHHKHPYSRYFGELMSVEKPGRYTGGEYGCTEPDVNAPLRIALCFPDLYEIGMSNNAIRIMYRMFNAVEGVSCERVFAPAPDFESLLSAKNIPLFSLESGTPLHEFDILAVSIGYELSATNVLTVLERGGIPIRSDSRGHGQPLVIAGGPAITNPAPFGPFFDAVFIGEAEAAMGQVLEDLVSLKKSGAGRDSLLERMMETGHFWHPSVTGTVRRAVWRQFGKEPSYPDFPVPGIKTVQDHGVVEIMRGCPNGCRFCHAGIFYRPFREKSFEVIEQEVQWLISRCGYREITITSLSSGDYTDVVPVVRRLNNAYGPSGISFSLPSLKVNSFTLPLLSSVSAVRKSGLTFAVETPVSSWQKGLNKIVELEKTVEIMLEAKRQGWRIAKFYFMIGLPVSQGADETGPIVEFLSEIKRRSGMNVNVNVGTFVPKPHTPYQWSAQLPEGESLSRITALKRELKAAKIQLRYHSPFASQLEGVITRGDARVADLIETAYQKGARLDAWEDHLDRHLWGEILDTSEWDVVGETCRERDVKEPLPWDNVSLGISRSFLERELERSQSSELTEPCGVRCDLNCGVCGRKNRIRKNEAGHAGDETELIADSTATEAPKEQKKAANRDINFLLFSFRKTGRAVFLSHLNIMTIFERAFLRAGLRVRYTEGFNPKPRLEFASPLSLGFSSGNEIGRVEIQGSVDTADLRRRLNESMHEGIRVTALQAGVRKDGRRVQSLMAGYWGGDFIVLPRDGMKSVREKLAGYLRLNDLETAVTFRECGTAFILRVRQAGKKSSMRNIARELHGSDDWWTGLEVRKVRSFRSSESEEPVSFFG